MREIKFRAWDKKNKVIVPLFYKWELPDGHIAFAPMNHLVPADFVPMQYIGQKDINGKEIYEGDICRQYWQGHEIIAPMIWNQDKLQFGLDAEVDFDTEGDHLEISVLRNTGPEVIGNIYETPELLK